MSSSALAGGLKVLVKASTSSMNFTKGTPRSFSPSVIESKLMSACGVEPLRRDSASLASDVSSPILYSKIDDDRAQKK